VTPGVKVALTGAVLLAACAPLLPVVALTASAPASGTSITAAIAGSTVQLNVDALPVHARGWAIWLLSAGSRCPEITAPLLAAQIDQESGWNATKVTPLSAADGGDARGLAQLNDGTNSPRDPPDAITALGKGMCELAAWAKRNADSKLIKGEILDLALAAWACGTQCVLTAGGVPAAGYGHDYPPLVRSRVGKYSLGPIVTGGWTRPLAPGSYSVGGGFGAPRENGRRHAGVDLMTPTGKPVYATADGVILQAECDSAYCDRPGNPNLPGCGNIVDIQHANGIVTRYCHLVSFAPGIAGARGLHVRAGQIIGLSGSTGHSSGPHLHFEVHLNAPPANSANAVDPEVFFAGIGLRL
jgi:murein DD-endopeptidase MepM/ murein hydrolase activator NlpD